MRCFRSSVMNMEAVIISIFPLALAAIKPPKGICAKVTDFPNEVAKRCASSMSNPA